MRTFIIVGLLLTSCLSGCSGIVKSFVETQPRVALDDKAFADPVTVVGGTPVAYTPLSGPGADPAIDADLLKHAPVIVQGFQTKSGTALRYALDDDAIGSPRIDAALASVTIDTSQPRVFTRVEHARVGGVELKQLVYAFWYPRRPLGSIETGSVDGGVLRITLDVAGEPAVVEYTQPCGCFHGVFVSHAVNGAAALEFGQAPPRRLHAVEPPLTGHDDWVVRDLITMIPDGRLTLYISAGKHFCQAIRCEPATQPFAASVLRRPYGIVPYAALEHAPREGGGEASIFDADGRVIGAARKSEQFMMSDLDHAGWPRHLDKMLIHWDAQKWTDPDLLATRLRLPATVSGHVAPPAAKVPTGQVVTAAAAPLAKGRRLILFTNIRCTGCQLTKKVISESAPIQRLLRNWDYSVVDTATPQGEQLAAEMRVVSTPVLVGFDGDREILREDDLDTADKITRAVRVGK